MEIELSLEKSVEESASAYFEKAKKAKKKLENVRKAIEETKKKLEQLELVQSVPKTVFPKRGKSKWFEAFHWFLSSDGFLVIAGKDAKSNEEIVKKYLEEADIFLHAEIHGASACIIKASGKKVPEETMREAAAFAAVFSRAWKNGSASVDVFAVKNSQVSKKAPSGESLGTGAFMVYGKRKWFRKTPMDFFVGVKKENSGCIVVSGPGQAVKKQSLAIVKIIQGNNDAGKTAKLVIAVLKKKLGKLPITISEVVRMLPGSNMLAVQ